MESITHTLGPVVAVLVDLVLVQKLEERRRKSTAERPPIREKLLRTAGHSARIKGEQLHESALTRAISCISAALALGYYLSRGRFHGSEEMMTALFLASVVIGALALTFQPLKQARDYRIGARGEEFMGGELAKVVALGYRVFHDFPGGANWNIDSQWSAGRRVHPELSSDPG